MNYAVGYFGAVVMLAILFAIGAVWCLRCFRKIGVVMVLIALGQLHAMATKPGSKGIGFPVVDPEMRYLYDAGSVVSNNFVHLDFQPSVILPPSAEIYLDYSDGTNTASWTTYTNATLATFPRPLDFEFPNAISNTWICFTTWTPGPSVHTNGIAQINWQLPSINSATNICAMLNTAIYTNDTKVVTHE